MRHIFINIKILNGEFEHNHKVLISTKCTNLQFAVNWYTAHFWGYGKLEDRYWEWDCGLWGRVYYWEEVPEEDFKVLNKYL